MHTTKSLTISPESWIVRAADVILAEVGGEVALMSVALGNIFVLNAVAGNIWRCIEQPIRLSKLIDTLLAEYNADRDTIVADVEELLRRLSDQSLVTISNHPPAG